MDKKLRTILTECIRDIETGARDITGCLERYPERAEELRPHLELWSGLDASSPARPNFAGQQRGQERLLAAISDMQRRGDKRMIPWLTPALAKAAAVLAGVVLLTGGAAGASAALGGPNVAGDVLSGIGISNASDTGREHANPNALDGADNAGQGIGNASETGRDHANPNALDGPDNADNHDANADGASDDGLSTANDNAPDQADDGLNTAGDAGAPDDVPPDSPPVPDQLPDGAPIPESLPVAPQP